MEYEVKVLWVFAFIFFVVLDLVTTFYGIIYLGAIEANSLPNYMIEAYGIWSLVVIKLAVYIFLFTLNKKLPHPYDTPSPFVLFFFGVCIFANNISVIFQLI